MKEATVIRGMLHTAPQGGVGFDAPSLYRSEAGARSALCGSDGRSFGGGQFVEAIPNTCCQERSPSIPISFFTPQSQM